MIVLPNPITIANRGQIIALLAHHRIPAVYNMPVFAREGGLLSYGADDVAQYRQAASYIDRILKGAKPADLPVQQASKFEFIINLKTAKALSLTVPPAILTLADELIDRPPGTSDDGPLRHRAALQRYVGSWSTSRYGADDCAAATSSRLA